MAASTSDSSAAAAQLAPAASPGMNDFIRSTVVVIAVSQRQQITGRVAEGALRKYRSKRTRSAFRP